MRHFSVKCVKRVEQSPDYKRRDLVLVSLFSEIKEGEPMGSEPDRGTKRNRHECAEDGGGERIRTAASRQKNEKHQVIPSDRIQENQPTFGRALSGSDRVCYLKLEHFWNVFSGRFSSARWVLIHCRAWPPSAFPPPKIFTESAESESRWSFTAVQTANTGVAANAMIRKPISFVVVSVKKRRWRSNGIWAKPKGDRTTWSIRHGSARAGHRARASL